jgi:branched-chain amino acid transport system substrate-binding protein
MTTEAANKARVSADASTPVPNGHVNGTRRRIVAGALSSVIALDSYCADTSNLGGTAQGLVVVQIGNFGEGAARTNATPEVVQLGEGMAACIARTNATGGIRARQLVFTQVADNNDPKVFINRFRQVSEQGAMAVLCPYGGVVVKHMLDEHVLDAAGPVVVGVVPGSEAFRNPGHPKLLHVRAGDGRQIARVFAHATRLGIRRVAVLAADNAAGLSGITEARRAAELEGAKDIAAFQSGLDNGSLVSAARAVVKSESECTIVVGPPRFMADAILALRTASFKGFVYALSYLSPELLLSVAREQATAVAIAQVYPNPRGITLPLLREFRAAMQMQFPAIGQFSAFQLEGYICARVLIEGLRRTRSFDGQSLAQALRTAGELNLGGYPVDFSQGNGGSRYTDIAMLGQDGQLKY